MAGTSRQLPRQKRKAAGPIDPVAASSPPPTSKRARYGKKIKQETNEEEDEANEEQEWNGEDGERDGSDEAVKCGRTFATPAKLRRHEAVHEKKEETTCPEPGCGRVFRKQETLQRHIKTDHLGERAYQCTHVEVNEEGIAIACGQSFNKPAQLKSHGIRDHSGNRFFCDVCSPGVPPDDGSLEQVDSPYQQATKVGFQTYAELQTHIRIVHPPTCSQCGQPCETNRALKAHIDIEHSTLDERQQNFRCTWPGCDRGFTKSGNLKVHLQNFHAKARKFVCGEFALPDNPKVEGWNGIGCGNAFGTKANLEEHVRTQHLGMPAKVRPCRRRKAESASETPSTTMDVDELATPSSPSAKAESRPAVLSMLTGIGYADRRPLECLIHGCPNRFGKEYELATHLELTHGWQVDDVNDRLAEKRALEGGEFWVGGVEEEGEEGEEEEALREQLEKALRPLTGSERLPMLPGGQVHKGEDGKSREQHERVEGVAVNGMLGGEGEAMVLDPALLGQ
ncbi:hypothetical protein B0A50_01484 [Salinomyces thailandicus]|uniref:C2H2-type domain-containing protein n=1 Tax=Salinomyces thailandicus TaxID=706561 RepID=A0A4U0UAQ4_9PEZI|nr:hypothetical protein B0A50_01484 [Salinomyces thailandica]